MKISPKLILAGALWLAAAGLVSPVDELRERDRLTWEGAASSGVPADVRLFQKTLGSFRGWAIDALWLRAQDLLEKGEVHEAMQLADWITRLQPHFPKVWNFQAWNLAFNIALDARIPSERWAWVESGISLLRDRGLRSNPRSREIHRQLSYFYWFKVGANADEMHRYYKWQVARKWNDLLGPASGADGALEALDLSAAAPDSIEELLEGFPSLEPLENEILNSLELPQLKVYRWAQERSEDPGVGGAQPPQEALGAAEAFIRARLIEEREGMDLGLMADLVRILGPIDWRLPGAHAIYWSVRGTLLAGEDAAEEADGDGPLLAQRLFPAMVVPGAQIGLQQLVESGRLVFDEAQEIYRTFPRWRLLDSLYKVVRTTFSDPKREGIPDTYRENFSRLLRDAALIAWRQGDDESATRCRESLRELSGDSSEERYPLDRWVEERMRQILNFEEDPEGRIVSILGQTILDRFSGGDEKGIERTVGVLDRLHRELLEAGRVSTSEAIRIRTLRELLRAPAANIGVGLKAKIWASMTAAERLQLDSVTRLILLEQIQLEGVNISAEFPGLDSDPKE